MATYENEIQKLLGKDVYTELLESVDCGKICEVDVRLISELFPHPKIGGNFKHASAKGRGFVLDRHAFRQVLCDWYQYCAYDYTTHQEAMDALLEILRDARHGM